MVDIQPQFKFSPYDNDILKPNSCIYASTNADDMLYHILTVSDKCVTYKTKDSTNITSTCEIWFFQSILHSVMIMLDVNSLYIGYDAIANREYKLKEIF